MEHYSLSMVLILNLIESQDASTNWCTSPGAIGTLNLNSGSSCWVMISSDRPVLESGLGLIEWFTCQNHKMHLLEETYIP